MSNSLQITAEDFTNGGQIPPRYTADGADISPALTIAGIHPDAESIALICDDPDAPMSTFTHWLIWNIPADTAAIPADIPQTETADTLNKAVQGENDFSQLGYRGSAPPSGTHTYRFKVYTLDTSLNIDPGADKNHLLQAMEGHILQQATLKGKYSR